jgi:hypothetical protein
MTKAYQAQFDMGAVGINRRPISRGEAWWSSPYSSNVRCYKCNSLRAVPGMYMAGITGVISQPGQPFTAPHRRWRKDGTWLKVHDKLVPLG